MSDLQCPARVFFAGAGESEGLADHVAAERVSAIWSGTTDPERATADRVAERLGLAVRADERLDRRTADESEAAAVERVSDLVQEVSDLTRGETSLLVGDTELVSLALRRLCDPVVPTAVSDHPLSPGTTVLVEVDSGGWRGPDRPEDAQSVAGN